MGLRILLLGKCVGNSSCHNSIQEYNVKLIISCTVIPGVPGKNLNDIWRHAHPTSHFSTQDLARNYKNHTMRLHIHFAHWSHDNWIIRRQAKTELSTMPPVSFVIERSCKNVTRIQRTLNTSQAPFCMTIELMYRSYRDPLVLR